jgi:3-oxoacyl-[acyl-carrier protein] reductase
MNDRPVMVITGVRKGIGRYLAEYYAQNGFFVVGCSRKAVDYNLPNFQHFCLDVAEEVKVRKLFFHIRQSYGSLEVLINNAGIALMNHAFLTPVDSVHKIFNTNFIGTFLFCREAGKLMQKNRYGRIVNFTSVAAPLKLEGEAIYAASKAAVNSLTQILAREFGEFGITVNAVGPTPVKTDLIRSVSAEKLEHLIDRQAIPRFGEFRDIANVIDFFIKPESDFITGQVIFLGGI